MNKLDIRKQTNAYTPPYKFSRPTTLLALADVVAINKELHSQIRIICCTPKNECCFSGYASQDSVKVLGLD